MYRVLLKYAGALAPILLLAACGGSSGGSSGGSKVSIPSLTVSWPEQKVGIDTPYQYSISGSVGGLPDISEVTVTIDGVDSNVPLVSGAFSTNATLSGQADDITVTVTDATGLSFSRSATAIQVAAGELDTNFNSGGFNALALANGGQFNEVVTDSQGRILAAGFQSNGSDNDFVLVRYTTEGILDLSFGGTGIVIVDSVAGGNGQDYGQALVIDENDNIYVIGNSYNGANYDLGVAKITSAGVLDTTYGGGDGLFNADIGANEEPLHAVLDVDGKLVVVGSINQSSNVDMVIWRVLANGSGLDTSFGGGNGYVIDTAAATVSQDKGVAVMIDDAGRYIVAGYIEYYAGIWRYLATGDIDTSYGGGNGYIIFNPTNFVYTQFHDIESTADGKILVSGRTRDISNIEQFNYVVGRYTADGVLDTTFGEDENGPTHNGYTLWNSPNDQVDEGRDMVQDAAGNIVITGYSKDAKGTSATNNFMAVVRFTASGLLDNTFGGDYDINGVPDGWFAHNNAAGGSNNDYGYGIAIDADGKLLIAGRSDSLSTGTDQVVWRLR